MPKRIKLIFVGLLGCKYRVGGLPSSNLFFCRQSASDPSVLNDRKCVGGDQLTFHMSAGGFSVVVRSIVFNLFTSSEI